MWPDDQKEGNGNLNIVLFALFRQVKFLHPKYFIMKARLRLGGSGTRRLTPTIAGSLGTAGGRFSFAEGPSSILRSLTSVPRKTMYS